MLPSRSKTFSSHPVRFTHFLVHNHYLKKVSD